jgi:hypothetical protein
MVVSVDPLETDDLFPELALLLENFPRHVKTDVAKSRERRHGIISFPVDQSPNTPGHEKCLPRRQSHSQVDMTIRY